MEMLSSGLRRSGMLGNLTVPYSATRLLGCAVTLLSCAVCDCAADSSKLVKVVRHGKETSLFEKVIVTSSKAMLKDSPAGEGQFMPPYSIFYKLKTDDGSNIESGHFRVGTQEGRPLGWIDKEYVAEWNTRYVLEPMQPTKTRFFQVELGDDTFAELKHVPAGKTRYGFITESAEDPTEENGPFPVIVCTAAVSSGGSSFSDELNDLRALQLEIVLVLEYTDAMTVEYGGKELIDYVRDMGHEFAKIVNKERNNPARFGIVVYQDGTSKATMKKPRVVLPLTDDVDKFVESLERLRPTRIEDDWQQDAISALALAINEAGWTSNSTKHVVHLTNGSFQLHGKGEGPNFFGVRDKMNSFSEYFDRTNLDQYPKFFGFNSSGLSMSQISYMAAPQGGNIENRLRNQKTFHGVWVGKPLEVLCEEHGIELKKVKELSRICRENLLAQPDDAKVVDFLEGVKAMGVTFEFVAICLILDAKDNDEALAQRQLRELTDNLGAPGYFNIMQPNVQSVREISRDLQQNILEAISAMAKIRKGEIDDAEQINTENEITERYYQIVGAAKEKFSGEEVIQGQAHPRDKKGRLVAVKKVLVTEADLKRLESTFDALHKTFQSKVSKVDRQDVTSILEDLQAAIAGAAAGQGEMKLSETAELKSLITSLPLRTNALDITPGDIAIMSSDAFTTWLEKLDSSADRIRDLLDNSTEWMTLNEMAENDRFTFLRLSELP